MKRKIILGILIASALLLLGALVAQYLLEGVFDVKLLVSAAGALAAALRFSDVRALGRKSRAYYESEYRDVLRGAFVTHDRGKRGTLLKAIDLYNRDQLKRALAILEKLKKHCQTPDDHAAVLIFSALCLTELGMTSGAVAAYREVCRHDPKRSTAWSNMGMLLEKKGERDEALDCYENALTYDMSNPYAYNNLAAAYYRMGEYEKAISFAEKALSLKGDLYQASNTLCFCHRALGDVEESEKYYQISVANGVDAEGLRGALCDTFAR